MRVIIFLVAVFCVTDAINPLLSVKYEWKYFDYDWEYQDRKDYWISRGAYDPKKTVPVDVDQSADGRTFITILKNPGTPATLNVVTNKRGDGGPLLKPYPDWSWHETEDCTEIINVFRIAIDSCNRLWVLDTGMSNNTHICPAKLYSFDLKTNHLLQTVIIPDRLAQNGNGAGMLVTPIVETYGERCEDTTIYMADPLGRALVIWDGQTVKRFEGNVFEPEEQYKTITIAGESFDLLYGTVGMALSPPALPTGHRYLSFRPLASRSMFAASTQDLKVSASSSQVNYVRGTDVLPSQAVAQVFSKSGTLFYGLTKEIAIGCWNINYPMQREFFKTILADRELLQFISGMKTIPESSKGRGEELLIMSDQLQKLYAGSNKFNDIRFRVLTAPIESLIKGTICEFSGKISRIKLDGHHQSYPSGNTIMYPNTNPGVNLIINPNGYPGRNPIMYPSGHPSTGLILNPGGHPSWYYPIGYPIRNPNRFPDQYYINGLSSGKK